MKTLLTLLIVLIPLVVWGEEDIDLYEYNRQTNERMKNHIGWEKLPEYPPKLSDFIDIPIYPSYIELEKDLVMELPYAIGYPSGITVTQIKTMRFPKGTKIYYK